MSSIRLHRQVCAFIDVLGGAALFRGKDRKRAAIFFDGMAEFERRLNGYSHQFQKKRQSSSLVKTFSDNIFVAFPFCSSKDFSDAEVVNVFISELTHQIYEMTLLSGFPMRGAISVGPLMFTENFLFGSALVDAVQLEKSAIFPRVILGKTALRYVKPEHSGSRLVLRDSDGAAFLDYLEYANKFDSLLERHKDYVELGLSENTTRIHERQKYEWLARYHNFSVTRAKRPQFLIPIERLGMFTPMPSGIRPMTHAF